MIIGVIIGVFVKNVQEAFNTVEFHGVSVRECPRRAFDKVTAQSLSNSDCYWSHHHDVAYPDQSPLREPFPYLPFTQTLDPSIHLPRSQLDHWSTRDACPRVGDTARPPYISDRRDHGRHCALHCNGHGLERTRRRRHRVLRDSGSFQLSVADGTVFAVCSAFRRHHWRRTARPGSTPAIRDCGYFCSHRGCSLPSLLHNLISHLSCNYSILAFPSSRALSHD